MGVRDLERMAPMSSLPSLASMSALNQPGIIVANILNTLVDRVGLHAIDWEGLSKHLDPRRTNR